MSKKETNKKPDGMIKPDPPPCPPDGGQAFPRPCGTNQFANNHGELGMSLRDWYKGKALLGLLAGGVGNMSPDEIAIWAGKYADAALREGGKS